MIVAPGDELNFNNNSFDLIVCTGVYECTGPEIAAESVRQISRVLKKGGKIIFLFASDRDFRIKTHNTLGLYGYSEEKVRDIFPEDLFSSINFDKYITTYENKRYEQNDCLITV